MTQEVKNTWKVSAVPYYAKSTVLDIKVRDQGTTGIILLTLIQYWKTHGKRQMCIMQHYH